MAEWPGRAGVSQPPPLQIGRACGPACLWRVPSVAQCQHRQAERFLVTIPLSGCYPVWLRHNFTPPTSDALQALGWKWERGKLHTLYPRLGIEDQRAHLRRNIRLCVTLCMTISCMVMEK